MKTAEDTLAELEQLFVELGPIAASQDVERFDRGVAMALDATSRLRVLQAPGLPFDVPRRYDALPRLTGRATVDLTIKARSILRTLVPIRPRRRGERRSLRTFVPGVYFSPPTPRSQSRRTHLDAFQLCF